MNTSDKKAEGGVPPPRLVAWEVTRSCNLNCMHCRAAAEKGPYPGELGTERSHELLQEIASLGKPIVILTGGEPLLREDLFDLAGHGTRLGLRMVMATNGTLLTSALVEKIISSGIQRVSVSLDGANAREHDRLRQVEGAYEGSVRGIRLLIERGVEFQVNTTITKHNAHQIQELLDTSIRLGAAAHHFFLLVPTGRAREMQDQEIGAEEYERVLHFLYDVRSRVPLSIKATCAPHYYRILRQEAHRKGESVDVKTYGLDAHTRGCLAGTAFCFIGYHGVVQPCGYLDVPCGDVKEKSFSDVWRSSAIFTKMRDFSSYQGKCGRCEYLKFCGGCRARAFESTGDFMAEEPLCMYQPLRK